MKKHPFQLPKPGLGLQTLAAAMKDSLKTPYIGVTQGGSSRKNKGAKVAARVAEVKHTKG
jgi:hypothetical protein